MNFKTFLSEMRPGIGAHGENTNDASEKTMINRIIALVMDSKKTPENYAIAYDFLESSWGGLLWDKYYELFHEKSPEFEGPPNKPRWTRFTKETRALFTKWKNGATYKGPEVSE